MRLAFFLIVFEAWAIRALEAGRGWTPRLEHRLCTARPSMSTSSLAHPTLAISSVHPLGGPIAGGTPLRLYGDGSFRRLRRMLRCVFVDESGDVVHSSPLTIGSAASAADTSPPSSGGSGSPSAAGASGTSAPPECHTPHLPMSGVYGLRVEMAQSGGVSGGVSGGLGGASQVRTHANLTIRLYDQPRLSRVTPPESSLALAPHITIGGAGFGPFEHLSSRALCRFGRLCDGGPCGGHRGLAHAEVAPTSE